MGAAFVEVTFSAKDKPKLVPRPRETEENDSLRPFTIRRFHTASTQIRHRQANRLIPKADGHRRRVLEAFSNTSIATAPISFLSQRKQSDRLRP
jgi:hypothetical protein